MRRGLGRAAAHASLPYIRTLVVRGEAARGLGRLEDAADAYAKAAALGAAALSAAHPHPSPLDLEPPTSTSTSDAPPPTTTHAIVATALSRLAVLREDAAFEAASAGCDGADGRHAAWVAATTAWGGGAPLSGAAPTAAATIRAARSIAAGGSGGRAGGGAADDDGSGATPGGAGKEARVARSGRGLRRDGGRCAGIISSRVTIVRQEVGRPTPVRRPRSSPLPPPQRFAENAARSSPPSPRARHSTLQPPRGRASRTRT